MGASAWAFAWLAHELPITCVPVMGKGNGAIITENHIVKSVATLWDLLCVLQLLDFVGVSYKLAISSPLQSPTLLVA